MDTALVPTARWNSQARYRANDRGGSIGLRQEETSRNLPGLVHRVAAGVDHREFGTQVPGGLGELPTVKGSRQPDIREEEVDGLRALEEGHRLLACRCGKHP